ncbi:hypothetical protein C8J57DRAFT_1478165 [Mycena rebaudengoi]|nr:hypothetical protein C8J57DRAFT_1478165 [Mycena rebaudengoi]
MSTTTGTSRKRKSDSAPSGSNKLARTDAGGAALVAAILANKRAYPIAEDEDTTRAAFVQLANYARSLEQDVVTAAAAPPPKSEQEIEAAAEKLRVAAVRGIKKSMPWKPTCKEGRAKWSYDGVCADAVVFGALLKLGEAPKFKTKKFPKEDFLNMMEDRIQVSVRYDYLRISGDSVNVSWKPDEGTFKFSGTYGK